MESVNRLESLVPSDVPLKAETPAVTIVFDEVRIRSLMKLGDRFVSEFLEREFQAAIERGAVDLRRIRDGG